MAQTKDKFLTVRLDPDVHGALTELARLNERTIAAEVRVAINERLEQNRYPSAAQVMEQDA